VRFAGGCSRWSHVRIVRHGRRRYGVAMN
jgi:hypothetical protein